MRIHSAAPPRPDLGDFAWASALRTRRLEQGGPTISAIVHTRNEERNLPDALRSLAWVDTVLVVDMESDDRTLEIAAEHGADILCVPNVGYVEPARNAALQASSGDWLLVLDADERIPEKLALILDRLARDDEADIVQIHWHTWIAGRFLEGSGWIGHYHTRFFRRGHVSWSGRIHEPPAADGRTVRVPYTPETAIVHFNYDDLSHFVAKLNRYTDKEAIALSAREPMSWSELAPHLRREFSWHYTPEVDGTLSAALAFSMLFYRFLACAKHWESLGFPEVGLPPDALTALRDLSHDGRTLHQNGVTLAGDGRSTDAAELLRRSVLEQLNLETLNDLAVIYAHCGRPEDAEALLRTCIALDERYEDARENLEALTQGPEKRT